MKIQILEDEKLITLDDNSLDNDAFVHLSIEDTEHHKIVGGYFPLRDLMSALIAFDAKRGKRLSEEEMMH